MAKEIANDKGFKVLELSIKEFFSIGGLAICDGCNKVMIKGYWVAVLNYSFCEKDYFKWLNNAIRYEEDKNYELSNFSKMKNKLNFKL